MRFLAGMAKLMPLSVLQAFRDWRLIPDRKRLVALLQCNLEGFVTGRRLGPDDKNLAETAISQQSLRRWFVCPGCPRGQLIGKSVT